LRSWSSSVSKASLPAIGTLVRLATRSFCASDVGRSGCGEARPDAAAGYARTGGAADIPDRERAGPPDALAVGSTRRIVCDDRRVVSEARVAERRGVTEYAYDAFCPCPPCARGAGRAHPLVGAAGLAEDAQCQPRRDVAGQTSSTWPADAFTAGGLDPRSDLGRAAIREIWPTHCSGRLSWQRRRKVRLEAGGAMGCRACPRVPEHG
jgi:hypothetical protein